MSVIAADRWLEATPALPVTAGAEAAQSPLTPAQVESWRSAGWTLVSGIFDDALVEGLRAAAAQRFPRKAAADCVPATSESGC